MESSGIDFVELADLQKIQDEFAEATGVASVITAPDGTPLTRPSNFCSLCNIIRSTEAGRQNCYRSDAILGTHHPDGPTIKQCLSGGLWDAGASITVGGRHVANWLIGQVRDETQSEENIREYARAIRVDEEAAAAAFREVPAMSLNRFQRISKMLFTLANHIANAAYQNGLQARLIAERRRVEEMLENERILLSNLKTNIPDHVFIKDRESRFLWVNDALAREMGCPTGQEFVGKTDFDFFPKEQAAAYFAIEQGIVATGQPMIDAEERVVWPDGQVNWISLTKVALRNFKGEIAGLLGIARDISWRKETEEKLQETNRALEEATARTNRLAKKAEMASVAKSEFLANMSHEIRTPMHGVMGMASLLLDSQLSSKQRRFAEAISSSGESLLILINGILDFSRIEAGKLELEILDFDLSALLSNFCEVFALQSKTKGLAFNCSIDPGVPGGLRGDPRRLRQVLNNLTGNAVKFTPNGKVSVRVSLVSSTTVASVLRFAVRDTGIGIPENKQALIFQKFTQVDASTSRHFGGSGLGLAISKQLVELMDGEIGVSSVAGQGSEFWFTACFSTCLHPMIKTEASSPPAPVASRSHWQGIRVLVAEDNPVNQIVATGLLEKLALQVDVVSNGAEAIHALTTIPYDLVLMDVQMPGMGGLEATRLIREAGSPVLNPRIPVVAVTANVMPEDQQVCLEAGMDGYLSKPVALSSLVAMLEKWLPKERDV